MKRTGRADARNGTAGREVSAGSMDPWAAGTWTEVLQRADVSDGDRAHGQLRRVEVKDYLEWVFNSLVERGHAVHGVSPGRLDDAAEAGFPSETAIVLRACSD